jgi:hypothetical protein
MYGTVAVLEASLIFQCLPLRLVVNTAVDNEVCGRQHNMGSTDAVVTE